MHLHTYPFDTQRCPLLFESFTFTMHNIHFSWLAEPVEVNPIQKASEFPVTDKVLDDCSQNYTTRSFPCVSLEFVMPRQLGYFVAQVFFPSTLLVALSWLAFWLRQDAPLAIGLLVLTSLTILSESVYNRNIIPQVSYVKAIDIWFAICFAFTFAVILVIAARDGWIQHHPQNQAEKSGHDDAQPGRRLIVVCRVVFPLTFLVFIIIYFSVYCAQ